MRLFYLRATPLTDTVLLHTILCTNGALSTVMVFSAVTLVKNNGKRKRERCVRVKYKYILVTSTRVPLRIPVKWVNKWKVDEIPEDSRRKLLLSGNYCNRNKKKRRGFRINTQNIRNRASLLQTVTRYVRIFRWYLIYRFQV